MILKFFLFSFLFFLKATGASHLKVLVKVNNLVSAEEKAALEGLNSLKHFSELKMFYKTIRISETETILPFSKVLKDCKFGNIRSGFIKFFDKYQWNQQVSFFQRSSHASIIPNFKDDSVYILRKKMILNFMSDLHELLMNNPDEDFEHRLARLMRFIDFLESKNYSNIPEEKKIPLLIKIWNIYKNGTDFNSSILLSDDNQQDYQETNRQNNQESHETASEMEAELQKEKDMEIINNFKNAVKKIDEIDEEFIKANPNVVKNVIAAFLKEPKAKDDYSYELLKDWYQELTKTDFEQPTKRQITDDESESDSDNVKKSCSDEIDDQVDEICDLFSGLSLNQSIVNQEKVSNNGGQLEFGLSKFLEAWHSIGRIYEKYQIEDDGIVKDVFDEYLKNDEANDFEVFFDEFWNRKNDNNSWSIFDDDSLQDSVDLEETARQLSKEFMSKITNAAIEKALKSANYSKDEDSLENQDCSVLPKILNNFKHCYLPDSDDDKLDNDVSDIDDHNNQSDENYSDVSSTSGDEHNIWGDISSDLFIQNVVNHVLSGDDSINSTADDASQVTGQGSDGNNNVNNNEYGNDVHTNTGIINIDPNAENIDNNTDNDNIPVTFVGINNENNDNTLNSVLQVDENIVNNENNSFSESKDLNTTLKFGILNEIFELIETNYKKVIDEEPKVVEEALKSYSIEEFDIEGFKAFFEQYLADHGISYSEGDSDNISAIPDDHAEEMKRIPIGLAEAIIRAAKERISNQNEENNDLNYDDISSITIEEGDQHYIDDLDLDLDDDVDSNVDNFDNGEEADIDAIGSNDDAVDSNNDQAEDVNNHSNDDDFDDENSVLNIVNNTVISLNNTGNHGQNTGSITGSDENGTSVINNNDNALNIIPENNVNDGDRNNLNSFNDNSKMTSDDEYVDDINGAKCKKVKTADDDNTSSNSSSFMEKTKKVNKYLKRAEDKKKNGAVLVYPIVPKQQTSGSEDGDGKPNSKNRDNNNADDKRNTASNKSNIKKQSVDTNNTNTATKKDDQPDLTDTASSLNATKTKIISERSSEIVLYSCLALFTVLVASTSVLLYIKWFVLAKNVTVTVTKGSDHLQTV